MCISTHQQWQRNSRSGFSIVEILTVIAIIGALVMIVLPQLNGARENARDRQRISDLQQIQVALRLYADTNGNYPSENGIIGGNNDEMDELLEQYFPTGLVPQDPLHDGERFFYYYDGAYSCTNSGGDQVVVYANTMEVDENKNHDDVCSEEDENRGDPDSHYIHIPNGS